MRSNRPFPETLAKLLEEDDISHRELARRTKAKYKWGALPTINRLVRGEIRVTEVSMKNIAGALGISPDTFAEYRLLKVRQSLDPDHVKLETALKNLREIEVIRRGADADEPEPHRPKVEGQGRRAGRGGRAASS